MCATEESRAGSVERIKGIEAAIRSFSPIGIVEAFQRCSISAIIGIGMCGISSDEEEINPPLDSVA